MNKSQVQTAGSLSSWRVLYRGTLDDDDLLFLCEADDIEHAVEQCRDAEPEAVIVGAMQEGQFAIIPSGEGDFSIDTSRRSSAWVTAGNLSLHVRPAGEACQVDVYPRCGEMDEPVAHLEVEYGSTAVEFFTSQGLDRLEIQSVAEGLTERALQDHLKAIEQSQDGDEKDVILNALGR